MPCDDLLDDHSLEVGTLLFNPQLKLPLGLELFVQTLLYLHLHLQCLGHLRSGGYVETSLAVIVALPLTLGFCSGRLRDKPVLLQMTLDMIDRNVVASHQTQH